MSINHGTSPSRSRSSDPAELGLGSPDQLVIIAIGIDTVHVPRFAAVIARRPGLIDRLFTEDESHLTHRVDRPQRSPASLAARFAAKEAVAKALGAPAGLRWHDCRIVSVGTGRPIVEVRGTVAEAARHEGIERWFLSLTHDGDYASAQVLAEGATGRLPT